MSIIKPTPEQLSPLLQEATESQTIEEFKGKFLNGVVTLLKRDPLRYRAYGPYWWPLKQAIIDAELDWFENHVDAEWLESMQYEQVELNLLAAWSYSEAQLDRGAQMDQRHILESSDGSIEFVLVDEAMEELAIQKDVNNIFSH